MAMVGVLLLALALRLAPWGQDRFLEDEALYAYWGLQVATGADPMLDDEPVDKPPLYPYLLALGFLVSPSQTAGIPGGTEAPFRPAGGMEGWPRLPSLLASVTSVALVYALGRALYGQAAAGLLAALLLALSPFDILFASTAFTDPVMTALVLGGLLAAAKGRLGAAGVLAGLAAATKQQGLFYLPLVAAVGVLSPGQPQVQGQRRLARFWRSRGAGWLWFGLGFAAMVGGAIWWDLAREQRPGFLAQSLISYGGLGPAQPRALGERAADWLALAGDFWVSPWLNALLLGLILMWLAGGLVGWWARPKRIDAVLAAFAVCYLAIHWLVGFQVWDRYLLGLVPLAALLAARAVVGVGGGIRRRRWRQVYALALGLALGLALTGPVVAATRGELPLGGDHGAYDGIDDVAAYMRTRAEPGAVLYHYWLGYHYRFYLYSAPLRLHWYPDLADLAHDATVYRREPRYIAFPSWRDGGPATAALAEAGIRLEPVLETTRRDGSVSFRLYRLEGP
jgi:4-amino-4-deoxy-L-arabinose transferase-like glycosyltransferase